MAETKAKSAKTQEPAEKSKQELILDELIKKGKKSGALTPRTLPSWKHWGSRKRSRKSFIRNWKRTISVSRLPMTPCPT